MEKRDTDVVDRVIDRFIISVRETAEAQEDARKLRNDLANVHRDHVDLKHLNSGLRADVDALERSLRVLGDDKQRVLEQLAHTERVKDAETRTVGLQREKLDNYAKLIGELKAQIDGLTRDLAARDERITGLINPIPDPDGRGEAGLIIDSQRGMDTPPLPPGPIVEEGPGAKRTPLLSRTGMGRSMPVPQPEQSVEEERDPGTPGQPDVGPQPKELSPVERYRASLGFPVVPNSRGW